MNIRKVIDETPMFALGMGSAIAGGSLIVLGIQGVRRNLHGGAIAMTLGAVLAHFGTQIAIRTTERMRGLQ